MVALTLYSSVMVRTEELIAISSHSVLFISSSFPLFILYCPLKA